MGELTLGLTAPFSHGRGFTEVASVASPAAGAGFTYTVGGTYWERLVALTFRLVSDGNAANRAVTAAIVDGNGHTLVTVPAAAVQAASLTRDYSFLAGQSSAIGPLGGVYLSPFPALFLQPAWTVVVGVDQVQATDAVTRIQVVRERFSTGPNGYPLGVFDAAQLQRVGFAGFELVGD